MFPFRARRYVCTAEPIAECAKRLFDAEWREHAPSGFCARLLGISLSQFEPAGAGSLEKFLKSTPEKPPAPSAHLPRDVNARDRNLRDRKYSGYQGDTIVDLRSSVGVATSPEELPAPSTDSYVLSAVHAPSDGGEKGEADDDFDDDESAFDPQRPPHSPRRREALARQLAAKSEEEEEEEVSYLSQGSARCGSECAESGGMPLAQGSTAADRAVCPNCGEYESKGNADLNRHLDLCLNRMSVREAVAATLHGQSKRLKVGPLDDLFHRAAGSAVASASSGCDGMAVSVCFNCGMYESRGNADLNNHLDFCLKQQPDGTRDAR